jgi:hypothetical protein
MSLDECCPFAFDGCNDDMLPIEVDIIHVCASALVGGPFHINNRSLHSLAAIPNTLDPVGACQTDVRPPTLTDSITIVLLNSFPML